MLVESKHVNHGGTARVMVGDILLTPCCPEDLSVPLCNLPSPCAVHVGEEG